MPRSFDVSTDIRGKRRHDPVGRAIRRRAARQHGVVTRRQLVELGLTPRQVEHRLANGELETVHRRVYALCAALLTREGRWMAAVLATGDGAVLSHASAAAL